MQEAEELVLRREVDNDLNVITKYGYVVPVLQNLENCLQIEEVYNEVIKKISIAGTYIGIFCCMHVIQYPNEYFSILIQHLVIIFSGCYFSTLF